MASPTVVTTNTGTADGSAATSHTVGLPASLVSGNLLLIIVAFGNDPGTVSAAGWTFFSNDGSSPYIAFGYKTSDGTEGASVTVSSTNSVKCAPTSYQISGWQGTPERGTAATATSTNANPPSVSPSWGSADNLFIAAMALINTNQPTAAPTNYSNLLATGGAGAGRASVGSAERQLTASSDDPGTFTNVSGTWVAQTYVIQPAAAASTVKQLGLLGVG